jgi:DNA-binding HxlR family transcriptional regulator
MATRSATQRRQEAKIAYDAYLAECPSRRLLDRFSSKWVTLVIAALSEGDLRYSGLSRRLVGVSQKMLTQTLRTLERDGMITRRVTAEVPVRVDYSLTPLGRSLAMLVSQFKAWAETNMDQVDRAQRAYDRKVKRDAGSATSTPD